MFGFYWNARHAVWAVDSTRSLWITCSGATSAVTKRMQRTTRLSSRATSRSPAGIWFGTVSTRCPKLETDCWFSLPAPRPHSWGLTSCSLCSRWVAAAGRRLRVSGATRLGAARLVPPDRVTSPVLILSLFPISFSPSISVFLCLFTDTDTLHVFEILERSSSTITSDLKTRRKTRPTKTISDCSRITLSICRGTSRLCVFVFLERAAISMSSPRNTYSQSVWYL